MKPTVNLEADRYSFVHAIEEQWRQTLNLALPSDWT